MKLIDDNSKLALVISGTKAGARAIYSQNITLSEIVDVRLYRANSFAPCYSYQRLHDLYCYSVYHKVSDYMRRTGYWSVSLYLHKDYILADDIIFSLLHKISEIFEREYVDTSQDKILDVKVNSEYFTFLNDDSSFVPRKHFENIDESKNKTGFYTYDNEEHLKNLFTTINPLEEPELDFLLILDSNYKEEYDKLKILNHYSIPSHPRNIEISLSFKSNNQIIGNIDIEIKKGSKILEYACKGDRYFVPNLSGRDVLDISIMSNEYKFESEVFFEKVIVGELVNFSKEIKLKEIPKKYPLIISIANDHLHDIKKLKVDETEYEAEQHTKIMRHYFKNDKVKIEIEGKSKDIHLTRESFKDGRIVLKLSDHFKVEKKQPKGGTVNPDSCVKKPEKKQIIISSIAVVILLVFAFFYVRYLISNENKNNNSPVTTTKPPKKNIPYKIKFKTSDTNLKLSKDSISYIDSTLVQADFVFDTTKAKAVIKQENDSLFFITINRIANQDTIFLKIKDKNDTIIIKKISQSENNPRPDPCANKGVIIKEINEIQSIVENMPTPIRSVDNDQKLTIYLQDEKRVKDFGKQRNKWLPFIDNCPDVKSAFNKFYRNLKDKFPNWEQ